MISIILTRYASQVFLEAPYGYFLAVCITRKI